MMSLVFTSLMLALTLVQAGPARTPDFTGTWAIDRSRSQSPGSVTLGIKQTATDVSVETTRGGTASVTVYTFEPSPQAAAEAITAGHSHAYWSETKLVTETSGNIQGQTVSYKQTRWLNAAGTEMTVETIVVVQHGYSIEGSKNYGTAKDVFVRTK